MAGRAQGRPPGMTDSASASALDAGSTELAERASELAAHLPAPLAPLARVAYDYRWS